MADRGERILSLYLSLMQGKAINKAWVVSEARISERTFERDVEALRSCLSDRNMNEELIFDKVYNCYRLEQRQIKRERRDFQPSEVLVLLSVLFESEALRSDEIAGLADAVIEQLPGDQQTAFRRAFSKKMVERPLNWEERPTLKLLDDLLYILNRGSYIRAQYKLSDGLEEFLMKPVELEYTPPDFYLMAYLWMHKEWNPVRLEAYRIGLFTMVRGIPEEADSAPVEEIATKKARTDWKELSSICQNRENFH